MELQHEDGLEKYVVDGERLKEFLVEQGFQERILKTWEGDSLGPDSEYGRKKLVNMVEDAAKEYSFVLPEQPYWNLSFKIGSGPEFDNLFLATPGLEAYITRHDPTYQVVEDVARGLSIITSAPVLVYGLKDRFVFPKLQVYEAGNRISASAASGNEIYDEDYWKADEEAYVRRATSTMRNLGDVYKNMLEEDDDFEPLIKHFRGMDDTPEEEGKIRHFRDLDE